MDLLLIFFMLFIADSIASPGKPSSDHVLKAIIARSPARSNDYNRYIILTPRGSVGNLVGKKGAKNSTKSELPVSHPPPPSWSKESINPPSSSKSSTAGSISPGKATASFSLSKNEKNWSWTKVTGKTSGKQNALEKGYQLVMPPPPKDLRPELAQYFKPESPSGRSRTPRSSSGKSSPRVRNGDDFELLDP